jgi:hypothetical protein
MKEREKKKEGDAAIKGVRMQQVSFVYSQGLDHLFCICTTIYAFILFC